VRSGGPSESEPQRDDGLKEACGVFGVYAPGQPVAHFTYLGLYALQHRGQESAGIAVADGRSITVVKDMGLVPNVFNERTLGGLPGHFAIGHTRYSTTGASTAPSRTKAIHSPQSASAESVGGKPPERPTASVATTTHDGEPMTLP